METVSLDEAAEIAEKAGLHVLIYTLKEILSCLTSGIDLDFYLYTIIPIQHFFIATIYHTFLYSYKVYIILLKYWNGSNVKKLISNLFIAPGETFCGKLFTRLAVAIYVAVKVPYPTGTLWHNLKH